MKTVYSPEEAAQECIQSSIIQLFFSRPRKNCTEQKLRIHKIILKKQPYYQIETFKNKQVFQKNIEPDCLIRELILYFTQFRSVECRGLNRHLFFLQNNKGEITLTKQMQGSSLTTQKNIDREHNKTKDYLIPEGKPLTFLTKQGVMNEKGTVLRKMYHKFRQINKFLEFIANVEPFIREYTAHFNRSFSIIDFGCGKAYLSFALYYYLHEQQGLPIQVHGLDLKTEVVQTCTHLAKQCGYEGLTFSEGNIAEYQLPEDTGMMVCLHACNTATDLALAQAIRQKVPIIFAIPCCQHELYEQLKANKTYFRKSQQSLLPFMEHGIITERFATLLTDTVRALLLEASGYTVRIMEFIETEHTPKNILIHAVKKTQSPEQDQKRKAEALKKYRNIKDNFLIEPMLEKLLHEQLSL